ncbi:MAG: DUF4430 domain-containing protein, partial [Clostridia bacterium]|nr:DUF4430 domain-containing protein [Clostridia bacterium]
MNTKRLLSLFLSLVMVLGMIPFTVSAEENLGQVRVIVENTVFSKEEGAPWDGVLVDKWVDLNKDSTMMSCFMDALGTYKQEGAESGYITSINGLEAGSYPDEDLTYGYDGWMGTLNDWFTNEGFSAYTVAAGTLSANDEIRILYTLFFGEDVGGSWSNNDKSLKALTVSEGSLTPDFASGVKDYTLTLPAGTNAVTVTPTAVNKNFQVRTSVGDTVYKRTEEVPVGKGTVIKVVCGDPAWPSMNSAASVPADTYTLTVAYEAPKPTAVYEYDLPIRTYITTQLTLQATTKYDTEHYTAEAVYTNASGEDVIVPVNSGAITYLKDIPFGATDVCITLTDKDDPENSTVYTFHVTRPRDTTKTLKSNGIVLVPDGRDLLASQYNGKAEGTMFQADAEGNPTTKTGVSGTVYNYRAYTLDGLKAFTLTYTGNTAYTHLRYSADDGETWSDPVVQTGTTAKITFPETEEGNAAAKVIFQVVDDASFMENGFVAENANTYTVWVEAVNANAESAQILTVSTDDGDWYPVFDPAQLTYAIVVPNGTTTKDLTFTVTEGATVAVGSKALEPNEDGTYTLTMKTSAQTVNVTSADGIINGYSFKIAARSAKAYADKIADFLCINSQYTNTATGGDPYTTLSGSLKSLGNFGGYITYYFDTPLTDDPNNKYGVDFYAYGNSFSDGGSAAENGQVWVSEDGETWYALAGSEHYEDDILWDYEITYSRTASGKTAWKDNYGNENDGSSQAGNWVKPSFYYLNDLAAQDTITLKGILMPAKNGTIRGDSSTGENSFTHPVSFGYVDYFGNGTIGADVNPYVEKPTKNNGFDLAWAVNEDGTPVDVSGMEFHYVKVVTASNIWAGAFNEKSTESSGVVRTTAQSEAVGKTEAPVITVNGMTIALTDEENLYGVLLDGPITVAVTAADGANVYINHERTTTASFDEIPTHGYIRVIVQSGDCEPYIVTLAPYAFKGEGTEENPYLMETALDMTVLSSRVAEGETFENTYFAMTADITLPEGWTPIGTGTKQYPFSGSFDGQGHTITIPKGEKAPFGVTVLAYLHDFNIYGEEINGCGVV